MSWWNAIATNEFTLKVLLPGLVSGFVAYVFHVLKARGDRQKEVNSSAIGTLKEVCSESHRITALVQKHLRGDAPGADRNFERAQDKSKREVLDAIKQLSARIGEVRPYMSVQRYENLEAELAHWKTGLTSEPFPVSKKTRALQMDSPSVDQAHARWISHIARLTLDFLNMNVACGQ